MENDERTDGAEDAFRVTSRVTTRDYAEENLPRATSQTAPRSRYGGDFNFGPSLRHRISNLATSPSPGPAHSWRDLRHQPSRRSVAIAAPSVRGNATDTASRKFSLAGPSVAGPSPLDTVAVNQPYVDPGYAQLNPAYDQPVNVRPVWGLAKPLPRVLRPGMVPTKDEVEHDVLEDEEAQAQPPDDIEAGRIEPSLRPDKAASVLDTIRREREYSLIRAYEHRHQYLDSPTFSAFSARRPSDAPTVTPSARVRHESPIQEETSSNEEPQAEPPELSLPEAVAGLKAAKAEEEELKEPYQDAIPLSAYQAEDDEVHNLHTYWSIVRLRFREPLAELLAVSRAFSSRSSALDADMFLDHGSIYPRLQRQLSNDRLQGSRRCERHRHLGVGSRDHAGHLHCRWDIRSSPEPSNINHAIHLPRLPTEEGPRVRGGTDARRLSSPASSRLGSSSQAS